MTEREAYDLLARTPGCGALRVARALSRGVSVTGLAASLARPEWSGEDEPFLTPACADYPDLLRELPDPPLRLFHRGQPLSRLSPHRVAVVGSRKASSYGVAWSRSLGAALARQGITVCSGLAVGIDAAAHQGALMAGASQPDAGTPVAVLGHGWEHIYPEQNRALAGQIQERGVLLTEYPPAHPPTRFTFPERNRIIAGLCQTVVVVEASQRSGSLHTARFAIENGRDVWVVPQRPGTPNSAGVLGLLRDGANPMFDIDEFVAQLVEELQVTYPFQSPLPLLSPELSPLLTALAQDEEASHSWLCQSLGLSPRELASRLGQLELTGVVERRFDGGWSVLRWDLVEQTSGLCRERPREEAA